jgi:hypothetical protein
MIEIIIALRSVAATHARNVLFTLGFASIVTGVCLKDLAVGLMVAGLIVCGLIVWDMIRTPSNP